MITQSEKKLPNLVKLKETLLLTVTKLDHFLFRLGLICTWQKIVFSIPDVFCMAHFQCHLQLQKIISREVDGNHHHCDQIGRFIAFWATFQSLWQQLFCPNCPHFQAIFVKVSKSFIFLVKSFLATFYTHLATYYWSH